MQSQTNETITKITSAESDEEAATNFKGIIKLIISKTFKQKNARISDAMQRLSESDRDMDNEEEEENSSGEDMEIEKKK